MKKNILTIGIITALGLGMFSTSAIAKQHNTETKSSSDITIVTDKVRHFFTKEYNHTDLLNLLASIENDLVNNDIKAAQSKSGELLDYIQYHKKETQKLKEKNSELNYEYKGDRVLEVKYGGWFSIKKVILPLLLDNKILTLNFLKTNIELSSKFQENEINSAKVRYVSFDVENNRTNTNLYELLSSIQEGKSSSIRENIKDIYDNILIDHDDKVSLVTKIRDSLNVAKFLVDNEQFKAAENSIDYTDTLSLRLIESMSDSPREQQKVRNLRKDLKKISKISDRNYVSEWEKLPEEVGNWWKNQ